MAVDAYNQMKNRRNDPPTNEAPVEEEGTTQPYHISDYRQQLHTLKTLKEKQAEKKQQLYTAAATIGKSAGTIFYQNMKYRRAKMDRLYEKHPELTTEIKDMKALKKSDPTKFNKLYKKTGGIKGKLQRIMPGGDPV